MLLKEPSKFWAASTNDGSFVRREALLDIFFVLWSYLPRKTFQCQQECRLVTTVGKGLFQLAPQEIPRVPALVLRCCAAGTAGIVAIDRLLAKQRRFAQVVAQGRLALARPSPHHAAARLGSGSDDAGEQKRVHLSEFLAAAVQLPGFLEAHSVVVVHGGVIR